jgi:hypothetical protein
MICNNCNNVYDDEYQFCPRCGQAKVHDKKVVVRTQEPDTPQTCSTCHRGDRAIIARAYAALQYEKLTSNPNSKVSPLFDLTEILGQKPKGFLNSIFDSKFSTKLNVWEEASCRFMNGVYYCERCDEFFFTAQGQKKHGQLPELTLFLYGSYYNPITNRIHLPRNFAAEIRQLVSAKKANVACERIQQIIGNSHDVPSHVISAYVYNSR